MEYRRSLQSQVWHFCRNCPEWPSEFNLVITTKPLADAHVCGACLALHERGECKQYESAYQSASNGADSGGVSD